MRYNDSDFAGTLQYRNVFWPAGMFFPHWRLCFTVHFCATPLCVMLRRTSSPAYQRMSCTCYVWFCLGSASMKQVELQSTRHGCTAGHCMQIAPPPCIPDVAHANRCARLATTSEPQSASFPNTNTTWGHTFQSSRAWQQFQLSTTQKIKNSYSRVAWLPISKDYLTLLLLCFTTRTHLNCNWLQALVTTLYLGATLSST